MLQCQIFGKEITLFTVKIYPEKEEIVFPVFVLNILSSFYMKTVIIFSLARDNYSPNSSPSAIV